MKYYGDVEITGKATVNGEALTSSKIKADEILIGS